MPPRAAEPRRLADPSPSRRPGPSSRSARPIPIDPMPCGLPLDYVQDVERARDPYRPNRITLTHDAHPSHRGLPRLSQPDEVEPGCEPHPRRQIDRLAPGAGDRLLVNPTP